jgi:hypothetical protein
MYALYTPTTFVMSAGPTPIPIAAPADVDDGTDDVT